MAGALFSSSLLDLPATIPIQFADTTAASGIKAIMRCGSPQKQWIPEANGSGVAWLDYDNDGLMDLLIVNGSNMENLRQLVSGKTPAAPKGAIDLYRNLGAGRFKDVTSEAGLADPYWGTGANAADYNNDGFTDIFVTTIGRDLLYRNNGNGTFTEVAEAAGLSPHIAWHTGSAFGDYDNDGKLDLFVAGYVQIQPVLAAGPTPPVCNYRGVMGFCGPKGLAGERDLLYHNNGDGTFREVSEQAGVADREGRHGFTAVFDDFNGDGKIDLFVANDSDPNYLYLNQGDGTFKERALESGVAFNENGETQANMGVAVGDYDGNGLPDIFVTTFSQDYFPLFRQVRPGLYEEGAASTGLANQTRSWLGWACGFTDFDNDGHPDLWIANGHVYPQIDRGGQSTYNEPVAVFRNHVSQFVLEGPTPAVQPNSYRGGAAGDFDNDGRVDLIVLPISGSPVLLRNQTRAASWIGFTLRGRRSNRDGIGAKVQIRACGITQMQTAKNGGSYISRDDGRIHFGIGECSSIEQATVLWPTGYLQTISNLKPNRYLVIDEEIPR